MCSSDLMRHLRPRLVSAVEDINPRAPWSGLPDCLACHVEFERPESVKVTAFNQWAENDDLYRNRVDEAGLMCQACHGSAHAEHPAVNPFNPDSGFSPAHALSGEQTAHRSGRQLRRLPPRRNGRRTAPSEHAEKLKNLVRQKSGGPYGSPLFCGKGIHLPPRHPNFTFDSGQLSGLSVIAALLFTNPHHLSLNTPRFACLPPSKTGSSFCSV